MATARERFAAAVAGADADIDLERAALWVAAEAYPQLDVDAYVARLDALGRDATARVGDGTPADRVARLNTFLFDEQAFAGNASDYYDPRNSFLNEVIDRRTGIPLTLSLVYMAVARRAGLGVVGVSFPGHFLAKLPAAAGDVVVDAFFGRILSEEDCAERLRTAGAHPRRLRDFLRAASSREILIRLLRNLKLIYLQQRDFPAALTCVERILLLDQTLATEIRDRGLIYRQLECFGAAADDLERFLELAPDDPTAEAVRATLIAVRSETPRLH